MAASSSSGSATRASTASPVQLSPPGIAATTTGGEVPSLASTQICLPAITRMREQSFFSAAEIAWSVTLLPLTMKLTPSMA